MSCHGSFPGSVLVYPFVFTFLGCAVILPLINLTILSLFNPVILSLLSQIKPLLLSLTHCLATLHMLVSPRTDWLGFHAVFSIHTAWSTSFLPFSLLSICHSSSIIDVTKTWLSNKVSTMKFFHLSMLYIVTTNHQVGTVFF